MMILMVGSEPTSAAIAWALYYLSKDQEAQNKLRKEIIKEFPDKDFVPTFEQINSLEYLDAVCRETFIISLKSLKNFFFFSSLQKNNIYIFFFLKKKSSNDGSFT